MPANANTVPDLNYHGAGGSFVDAQGTDTYVNVDPFETLLSPNLALAFPDSAYITLSSREVSFAPNTLGQTNHTYTSPNYVDITALARYFADWSASYTIKEGPLHTITVSVAWDTLTEEDWFISSFASTQWELVPNVGTKSLLYTGLITNPFGPISDANLIPLPVAIQGAMTNAITNNQAQFLFTSGSPALLAAYASCSKAAQQTFQYLRAGIEGVPSYTHTLKRTAVVDIRNATGAFQEVVDEFTAVMQTSGSYNFVFSTKALVNTYMKVADGAPIPPVVEFMLPSYSKVYGIVGVDNCTYSVYAGWLIKPVAIAFVGRNKIQLTQEFLWDEWAAGLYFVSGLVADFPVIYNASNAINGA